MKESWGNKFQVLFFLGLILLVTGIVLHIPTIAAKLATVGAVLIIVSIFGGIMGSDDDY